MPFACLFTFYEEIYLNQEAAFVQGILSKFLFLTQKDPKTLNHLFLHFNHQVF